MNVEIIKCLEDNYSYLIIDSKKNACVVDPSEEGPVTVSYTHLTLPTTSAV